MTLQAGVFTCKIAAFVSQALRPQHTTQKRIITFRAEYEDIILFVISRDPYIFFNATGEILFNQPSKTLDSQYFTCPAPFPQSESFAGHLWKLHTYFRGVFFSFSNRAFLTPGLGDYKIAQKWYLTISSHEISFPSWWAHCQKLKYPFALLATNKPFVGENLKTHIYI